MQGGGVRPVENADFPVMSSNDGHPPEKLGVVNPTVSSDAVQDEAPGQGRGQEPVLQLDPIAISTPSAARRRAHRRSQSMGVVETPRLLARGLSINTEVSSDEESGEESPGSAGHHSTRHRFQLSLQIPGLASEDSDCESGDENDPSRSRFRFMGEGTSSRGFGREKNAKLAHFGSRASQIREYLYVAGKQISDSTSWFEQCGFTHVVNCAGDVCSNTHEHVGVQYQRWYMLDASEEDMYSNLYDVIDFLDRTRASGGKTLVHCHQGVSRSTTMCIAYLMLTENLEYDEAYRLVRDCRGITRPNIGFIGQLVQWRKRCTGKLPRNMLYRVTPHASRPGMPLYQGAGDVSDDEWTLQPKNCRYLSLACHSNPPTVIDTGTSLPVPVTVRNPACVSGAKVLRNAYQDARKLVTRSVDHMDMKLLDPRTIYVLHTPKVVWLHIGPCIPQHRLSAYLHRAVLRVRRLQWFENAPWDTRIVHPGSPTSQLCAFLLGVNSVYHDTDEDEEDVESPDNGKTQEDASDQVPEEARDVWDVYQDLVAGWKKGQFNEKLDASYDFDRQERRWIFDAHCCSNKVAEDTERSPEARSKPTVKKMTPLQTSRKKGGFAFRSDSMEGKANSPSASRSPLRQSLSRWNQAHRRTPKRSPSTRTRTLSTQEQSVMFQYRTPAQQMLPRNVALSTVLEKLASDLRSPCDPPAWFSQTRQELPPSKNVWSDVVSMASETDVSDGSTSSFNSFKPPSTTRNSTLQLRRRGAGQEGSDFNPLRFLGDEGSSVLTTGHMPPLMSCRNAELASAEGGPTGGTGLTTSRSKGPARFSFGATTTTTSSTTATPPPTQLVTSTSSPGALGKGARGTVRQPVSPRAGHPGPQKKSRSSRDFPSPDVRERMDTSPTDGEMVGTGGSGFFEGGGRYYGEETATGGGDGEAKDDASEEPLPAFLYEFPEYEELSMYDSEDLLPDTCMVMVLHLSATHVAVHVWIGEAFDVRSIPPLSTRNNHSAIAKDALHAGKCSDDVGRFFAHICNEFTMLFRLTDDAPQGMKFSYHLEQSGAESSQFWKGFDKEG